MTGLTWSTSDATVVSLSTDDPPVLTALAPGHVTILAGSASADVTVWAGALPVGTAVWSNPGDGSGVQSIVPAVPSATGVADVFALNADDTVSAITGDGLTAWTANANVWTGGPDFQGGLVFSSPDLTSIQKLDGKTGQVAWTYTCPRWCGEIAIHPDGTIFEYEEVSFEGGLSGLSWRVVGIDPTTGSAKFSVPVEGDYSAYSAPPMMIAGDGNLYVLHIQVANIDYIDGSLDEALKILVVSSSGDSKDIQVASFRSYDVTWGSIITNADQGILVSWEVADAQGSGPEVDTYIPHMSLVSATGASEVGAPQMPGDAAGLPSGIVSPVLQAQDGSFVGVACIAGGYYECEEPVMVSFDVAGNVRWVVPNMYPQIATADGGVIAQAWDGFSTTGPGYTIDANGNATGSVNLYTQSWRGNLYLDGDVQRVADAPAPVAESYSPFAGTNASGTPVAVLRSPAKLVIYKPFGDALQDCYSSIGNSSTGSYAQRNITYKAVDQYGGAMANMRYQEQLQPAPGSPCPGGTTQQGGLCVGDWKIGSAKDDTDNFEDTLSANPQTGHSKYTQVFWVATPPNTSTYAAFYGQIQQIDAYQPSPSPSNSLDETQFVISVNGNTGLNANGVPIRRCSN
ncbi:MAG TPA: PQQ-binding-like beta-propeller repeat protein [Bryobacteraceae bacterium]|nr:PQQ-binding-like beta-propeller repeat protein [Bryobacteraceae bacterium]